MGLFVVIGDNPNALYVSIPCCGSAEPLDHRFPGGTQGVMQRLPAEMLSGSVILGRRRLTVPGRPRCSPPPPAEGRHVSKISAHFLILPAREKIPFLAQLGRDSTRQRQKQGGCYREPENRAGE